VRLRQDLSGIGGHGVCGVAGSPGQPCRHNRRTERLAAIRMNEHVNILHSGVAAREVRSRLMALWR